jgi:hypothetical protein
MRGARWRRPVFPSGAPLEPGAVVDHDVEHDRYIRGEK